ncbi:MAG: CHASE2 domain-containing serine/threonine-protein kinase [Gammaproteobacteria bacterium]
MKKPIDILSADRLAGLLYVALFALAALWLAQPGFERLETAGYDKMMQSVTFTPTDRIAVIDIDDKSIAELGRMPWSRDLYERMTQLLESGGAKVVTYGLLFSEAQVDPGRDTLLEIQGELTRLAQAAASENADIGSRANQIANSVEAGLNDLDYDARLAASFGSSGNVLIPMMFALGQPSGRPDAELPSYIVSMAAISETQFVGIPASQVTLPIESLATRALRIGHLNQTTDAHDSVLRKESLVVDYYGEAFPSLALATAAAALNLEPEDIVATSEAVMIGPRRIATDGLGRFNPVFYSDDNSTAFPVDSFTDVFAAKVPADKYRDKVVLIGASAAGVGNRFATPTNPDLAPAMVLAHNVSSILQGDSIARPAWAVPVEMGICVLIGLYILVLLPGMRSRTALLTTSAAAILLVAVAFGFFSTSQVWLRLITPLLFLLGGHLVMTLKRFGVVERLRANSDLASAESNRMLGLAFQSQGQLDMAFEKFRKCPLDDSMMEPMYALALDFERKRQFNKAGAIYSYMAKHDANYRDLTKRIQRNQSLDETTILGQGSGVGGTRLLIDEDDNGLQKPMLGRYMVEKEIGRGAMGTVYLGRDPKINRIVAIKTIALSEEFDEDDLATARERFFREAETAGRLNHPDIVTVFDAGEELDLAYIAMEFLNGKELSDFTNQDTLLPVNTVLKVVARVAEALSYAHEQDVVHRDIKPANIMFERDSGDMKITDFGIARITNSSKTKTGIVLGTPSYMSPEQLAGKTVTGKSDLFSLAVTLFQLLTGQLPFRADSMATLMYKIANDEHAPLHSVRPELPPQLAHVIDTALSKEPADRYETGLEMAHDIRECLQHLAA